MAVGEVSSAGDEPLPTCSPDLALSHLDNKHTARLYCRYSTLKGQKFIRAILLAYSSVVEDISSSLSAT